MYLHIYCIDVLVNSLYISTDLSQKHTTQVALLAHDDSTESGDESHCEKKKLLLQDVSLEEEEGLRPCYQEDTDSDVSDNIFNVSWHYSCITISLLTS